MLQLFREGNQPYKNGTNLILLLIILLRYFIRYRFIPIKIIIRFFFCGYESKR
jgi:hypothetical protein